MTAFQGWFKLFGKTSSLDEGDPLQLVLCAPYHLDVSFRKCAPAWLHLIPYETTNTNKHKMQPDSLCNLHSLAIDPVQEEHIHLHTCKNQTEKAWNQDIDIVRHGCPIESPEQRA